jgi:3',5'-cyclic AMP phosphodiesterase CpdA
VRRIVHLSDLHFGRVDYALLRPLTRIIAEIQPHLVVVSGDLTQRAKPAQFREARAFLDTLPGTKLVVPGNHDVPLYNVFQRLFQPLAKYRRFISEDLEPAYVDDEIAVVGVNTARSSVFKGGRINARQIERLRARLCELGERITKIIVTHHPFDLPPDYEGHRIVGRAARAMEMFARCGADILLSGHLHASHAGDTTARWKIGDFSALVVQAGTATSTRMRGEVNSFNLLRIERSQVEIQHLLWNGSEFSAGGPERYDHTGTGWRKIPA